MFLHLILLGMAYIDYDISIEYRIYSNVKSRSYSDVFNFYFLKEVKLYQHLYNNKEIEEIKHKDLARSVSKGSC